MRPAREILKQFRNKAAQCNFAMQQHTSIDLQGTVETFSRDHFKPLIMPVLGEVMYANYCTYVFIHIIISSYYLIILLKFIMSCC